jgi:3-oxoacyl-[acyl-carrier-protein] synthase II
MGVCHPLGMDIESISNSLGTNLIKKCHLKINEEYVNEMLDKNGVDFNITRRIDIVSKIVLSATLSCKKRLGEQLDLKDHVEEIGVLFNTNFGALSSSKEFIEGALKNGIKNASPLIFPFSVPNAATGITTINLGVRGFNSTISGYNPVGYVYDLILLGKMAGCFVGGFEECSAHCDNILCSDNSFYSGSISDGSATLFVCTDDFAEANDLAKLLEIENFSTQNSCPQSYSLDNSNDVDEETIKDCIMTLLSNDDTKNKIKYVISSFKSGDILSNVELAVLDGIFKEGLPLILYPKLFLGETFGASSTFNIVFALIYSDKLKSGEKILVNNYDIGGNYSSILLNKL